MKKLDNKVKQPASILAYTLGIIASLIFGIGMVLAMKVIGDMMALGIVISVVGIILVSSNYFIYKAFLNHREFLHKERILALSNELLNK